MRELILGVDAGGTKTHAAVMDRDFKLLGLGVSTAGNWERVGLVESGRALSIAMDQALAEASADRAEVKAATFALAGIDWQCDVDSMSALVGSFGLGCEPAVMNDAFAVLFAGTADGIGVASIAGTGGKTVARDGHGVAATLGMAIGEGGGAGQIMREGLRVLAEMHHGQRPRTKLVAAVLQAVDQPSTDALFQSIARDGMELAESLAPMFFEFAHAGDVAAAEVVTAVARQHARDVLGLVRELHFQPAPIPLVRAGGLHTANSPIFDAAFNQAVSSAGLAFESQVLSVVPVVGSLIHAANALGVHPDADSRKSLFSQANSRNGDFWPNGSDTAEGATDV